jgi:hypothetical protein
MKEGTVLAKFEIVNRSADAKVKVTGKVVVVPIFDKGMPKEVVGLSVINRLRKIDGFIETSVIPEFESIA